MNRSVCLLFLSMVSFSVFAQNNHHSSNNGEMTQGLRRRALVLNIESRVLDEDQKVIWSENNHRIAIPGSPVGIQLVGSNLVVTVQFTPYIRRSGSVLVAQGQIWIGDQEKGVSYYTSIQTIPISIGEPIHFFPLGNSQQLNSSIEIILTVNPYSESAAGTGNGR